MRNGTRKQVADHLSNEATALMHIANDAALDLHSLDPTAALSTQAILNGLFAVAKEVRALRLSLEPEQEETA